MPKDNNIILKIQIGEQGDATRVLKLPPTTLVSDVCKQLAERVAEPDVADWGLIGKEKSKAVRLWLPDDEPLCAFPNINMHYLLFRRRDDVARRNRRESVQVQTTEAKPTSCIGVSPDVLDHVDDRGTQVPTYVVLCSLCRSLSQQSFFKLSCENCDAVRESFWLANRRRV